MKKIKLIKQTTISECGLCCVSMLASWYGYNKPISFYRSQYKVGRDGISLKDVYLIFENINFQPKVYNISDFYEFNFEKIPYMLLTKENHYIVFKKVNNKDVIIYDPATGKRKGTFIELECISGSFLITAIPNEKLTLIKEKISDFRHIRTFLEEVKPLFLLVLFSSVLAFTLSIFVPLVLETIINLVIENESYEIINIVIPLLWVIILYFIFFYLQNTFIIKLQTKLNVNISDFTLSHILRLPFSYFDDRGEANLLFRTRLLPQIQEVISVHLVQLVINFISMIIVAGYIMYRYFFLAPIIIGISISIGAFLMITNNYVLGKRQEEISLSAKVSEIQTEIITMIFQIKTSRLEKYFSEYHLKKLQKFNSANVKLQSKTTFFNLLMNIYTIFTPLLILLYTVNTFKEITIGELFFLYSVLGMLISYNTAFFSEVVSIYMIKPSLVYLNDVFDEKRVDYMNEDEGDEKFSKLKVKELSFKYSDGSGNVLSNINLELRHGEKIAIVGLSGSGKSTFVKVLSGLYPVTYGSVLINSRDISRFSDKFFNKNIAVIPQQTTLFNKTLRDNIILEKKHTTDDEIWECLKLVNMYDTISQLPLGLNTLISNNGANFSGGQLQRLALARVLIKKPSLLILDEATSSLDAVNEELIYSCLKRFNISLIIISHRLATVLDSDRIYVLQDQTIIETGTHSQLIENQGFYCSLYKQQYGG